MDIQKHHIPNTIAMPSLDLPDISLFARVVLIGALLLGAALLVLLYFANFPPSFLQPRASSFASPSSSDVPSSANASRARRLLRKTRLRRGVLWGISVANAVVERLKRWVVPSREKRTLASGGTYARLAPADDDSMWALQEALTVPAEAFEVPVAMSWPTDDLPADHEVDNLPWDDGAAAGSSDTIPLVRFHRNGTLRALSLDELDELERNPPTIGLGVPGASTHAGPSVDVDPDEILPAPLSPRLSPDATDEITPAPLSPDTHAFFPRSAPRLLVRSSDDWLGGRADYFDDTATPTAPSQLYAGAQADVAQRRELDGPLDPGVRFDGPLVNDRFRRRRRPALRGWRRLVLRLLRRVDRSVNALAERVARHAG